MMSSSSTELPESLKVRFADHLAALEARYRGSARFREICADYEELVGTVAARLSTSNEAAELRLLARELEEEILLELLPRDRS